MSFKIGMQLCSRNLHKSLKIKYIGWLLIWSWPYPKFRMTLPNLGLEVSSPISQSLVILLCSTVIASDSSYIPLKNSLLLYSVVFFPTRSSGCSLIILEAFFWSPYAVFEGLLNSVVTVTKTWRYTSFSRPLWTTSWHLQCTCRALNFTKINKKCIPKM